MKGIYMKKIAIVFSLCMLVSTAANAFVDSQYMKSEQFLYNTGYSKTMADMANFATQDPYREPYKANNNFKDITRSVLHYVIPTYGDDISLFNHTNEFKSSWKDY